MRTNENANVEVLALFIYYSESVYGWVKPKSVRPMYAKQP